LHDWRSHDWSTGARAKDAVIMVDKNATCGDKGRREGVSARNQPAVPRCFAGVAP